MLKYFAFVLSTNKIQTLQFFNVLEERMYQTTWLTLFVDLQMELQGRIKHSSWKTKQNLEKQEMLISLGFMKKLTPGRFCSCCCRETLLGADANRGLQRWCLDVFGKSEANLNNSLLAFNLFCFALTFSSQIERLRFVIDQLHSSEFSTEVQPIPSDRTGPVQQLQHTGLRSEATVWVSEEQQTGDSEVNPAPVVYLPDPMSSWRSLMFGHKLQRML